MTKKWKSNIALFLCIWMTIGGALIPAYGEGGNQLLFDSAIVHTSSNADLASDSELFLRRGNGDLWSQWTATDFKFLDGTSGKGTRNQPYQIRTKAHMMALSQLASLGMEIKPGDLERDTYVGDYQGAWFELMTSLNFSGMAWLPIGFYQNEDEMNGPVPHAFEGHFKGNGHTISNIRISNPNWNYAGLFGSVKNSTITDLNVQLSDTLEAGNQVGILVGRAQGDVRIQNCRVKGNVRGKGMVGGVVGYLDGDGSRSAVIEDCNADVTLDSPTGINGNQVCVGGIVGQADSAVIVDCQVETAGNATARIQGKGYVGGIVGFQNHTDIYNVLVASGTIGGNGGEAIGGITGYYIAGDIKGARMQGIIGSSGLGSYAHEGIFIGNKGSGCNFTYGTKATDDFAYLYTDTEAKLNMGVCGSDVADDNSYTYNAHVGFWHSSDLYFTKKQGSKTKTETEQYFYEELEQGILHILDEEINGRDVPFTINHVAPDSTGRPKRGYLIVIPQIDTVANGHYFYDVATLTVTGSGAYYNVLDKDKRGAVAEGTTVIIATSPKNTNREKYEMDQVPSYQKGEIRNMATYKNGGEYTFTMPSNDTEVTAGYKRVAANVQVHPAEYTFRVVQTRTGSRKSPTLTTVVTGNSGNEIARYVNGVLSGVQVQPVFIQKQVDANNDVKDSRVLWSVDDPGLIHLLENDDKDTLGYTDKSASIQVNLEGDFFQSIIREEEKRQQEHGYRYTIPSTIYGAGYAGGGVAILTAATRPSESFDGKPCTAQCRVKVTFQILDRTYVDIESVTIDKPMAEFQVVRTLTGNRKQPTETISVTPSQIVQASYTPSYYSSKDISWILDDPSIAAVHGDIQNPDSIRLQAQSEAKWIQDIIQIDREIKTNNSQIAVSGNGIRETRLTVKVEDRNGNIRTAYGTVKIVFQTVDRTGGSTGTGSGGGGGGGGGGNSSGVTPNGTTQSTVTAPSGAITGTWVQDATGQWLFTGNERTYTNEWAYIHNPYAGVGQEPANWFRFNEQGHMVTGWYTDAAGNTFFLHNQSDGTQGRMYLGWNWIDGNCYYFNPVSDGTRGMLWKGRMTPDGHTVNDNGQWLADGILQTQ